MNTTDKQTQPEGTRMVDLIDLAETIEDGIEALRAMAHANRTEYVEHVHTSIEYVANKLMDDITTLRANLTYRAATETGGTDAIKAHAQQKQTQ